jgi:hypothetical protein
MRGALNMALFAVGCESRYVSRRVMDGCCGYVTVCKKNTGCFCPRVNFLQPQKVADPLMKRYGAGNTAETPFARDSTKPVETFVERVLRGIKTDTKYRYLCGLPKK